MLARDILMLETHDSLKPKNPTYVKIAEYLHYTEDF